MQKQNDATRTNAPRAVPAAPLGAGPKVTVQSEPFYLTDKALSDGAINRNWTLDSPGTQTFGARVFFPQPFDTIPAVVAGITGINAEADEDGNWSVQMEVVDWQKDHFDVVVTKQGRIQVHLVNAVFAAWA